MTFCKTTINTTSIFWGTYAGMQNNGRSIDIPLPYPICYNPAANARQPDNTTTFNIDKVDATTPISLDTRSAMLASCSMSPPRT